MAKKNMRCREAIRRINENAGELDRVTVEHIKQCPSCARAAESARQLQRLLESAKTKDTGPMTDFSQMRSKIEEMSSSPKKETIMSAMKNQLMTRPKLLAGLGLALGVFLFITLVPFSYTTTVGYQITLADVPSTAVEPGRIGEALAALGYGEANVNLNEGECLISNLPDKKAAREAAIAFTALTGMSTEPVIEPMIARVSGSIYAQVMNNFRVEVDTQGKTDQEIAAEIRQKLAAGGMIDPNVSVTTTGDQMLISVSSNQTIGDRQTEEKMELQFDLNGSDKVTFDTPEGPPAVEVDTEGKTADEIKAEIEARLAAEGKDNAQVEVITLPDGRYEIKVTMEDLK
nr:hypothetical protein [candidate division Zixibacteria bacterium]